MPKPSKPQAPVRRDRMLRESDTARRAPLQAPAPAQAQPAAAGAPWPGRTRRDDRAPAGLAEPRVDLAQRYSGLCTRHVGIRADAIDQAARTVNLAFSSETRDVTVWDWDVGEVPEILSHAPGACDLSPFLNAGSVLRNHSSDSPVAVPVSAQIDQADRVGRAVVRFPAEDPDAARAFEQLRSGLVRGVSVGYRVLAWERVQAGAVSSQGHAGPCIVATKWRVSEISLTPVPADSSVGVGRNTAANPRPTHNERGSEMNPKVIRALVRAAGLSEQFAEQLVARNLQTVEEVEAAIAAERQRNAPAPAKRGKRRKPAAVGARGDDAADDDDGEGDGDDDGREGDDCDDDDGRASPASSRRTARQIRREERERCLEIQTAVRNAGLSAEFAEDLVERGVSLADALRAINAERADNDTPAIAHGGRGAAPAQAGAGVEVTADQWDKRYRFLLTNLGRRAHATLAGMRVGGGTTEANPASYVGGFQETDETRKIEHAHLGIQTFVRELLILQGCREASFMTPDNLWREILDPQAKARRLRAGAANNASADLSNALSNLQGKALMRAFMAAKPTWRSWCRKGSLSDFKIAPAVQLNDSGQMRETAENGEILDSKLDDGAENRQLALYARRVSLTLQMFINDDMDALGRLPAMMGKQAAVLPSRLVYTHLLANPTMRDGTALFDAAHLNLSTGGSSALGTTGLATAIKLFRNQTSPQAPNDTDLPGEPIDLAPRVLLVPPTLEYTGYQLVNPNLFVAESQMFKGKFELEVEPRLENSSYTGYSTAGWYLAAAAEDADTMEVSFLNGNENPVTGSWEEFERLAVQFRAWLACGAKALDWRGIVKSNGS